MEDKHIELPIDFRCECGECEGCCKDWEWIGGYTLEEGIKLAEYNCECKIYNELEKQKPWDTKDD